MGDRLALRTPGGNHGAILLRQDEVRFQLHFFESSCNFSLTQPNTDKFCFSLLNLVNYAKLHWTSTLNCFEYLRQFEFCP